MFQMDEKLFAELQKECCWFTLPLFEKLPDIDPRIDVMDSSILKDDTLVQRHIFAMIFGGHGYSVDLSKAKVLAMIKLGQIEKSEPKDNSLDDPKFLNWIGLYAQYNVLLGTVFAYLHNYPLASMLLMNGLKTRAINLSMPYCDFIKYIISKVEEMPAELAVYDGCGFSADEPMGSPDLEGGTLNARSAEMIISELEGDNGEFILSYFGMHKYGNLKRLGSTYSSKFSNPIDVYEVLAVDKNFDVKKIRFYFNGYFTSQNRNTVRLPKSFHFEPSSNAAQIFEVIN